VRHPLATSPASRRGAVLPQGWVEAPRLRSHQLWRTVVWRGSAARGHSQPVGLTGAACARAGLWLNIPDYDAPTQMVKPLERNTRYVDAVLTIPKARRVAAQCLAPHGWHARARLLGTRRLRPRARLAAPPHPRSLCPWTAGGWPFGLEPSRRQAPRSVLPHSAGVPVLSDCWTHISTCTQSGAPCRARCTPCAA
jgi:hypothetical protein